MYLCDTIYMRTVAMTLLELKRLEVDNKNLTMVGIKSTHLLLDEFDIMNKIK